MIDWRIGNELAMDWRIGDGLRVGPLIDIGSAIEWHTIGTGLGWIGNRLAHNWQLIDVIRLDRDGIGTELSRSRHWIDVGFEMDWQIDNGLAMDWRWIDN